LNRLKSDQSLYAGETRVFSAGLTIREMFEDREKFKRKVQEKIQLDMDAMSNSEHRCACFTAQYLQSSSSPPIILHCT
jgi:hypothetical protein